MSDSDAQKMRPPMLKSDSKPTKPAAIVAIAAFCPASSAAEADLRLADQRAAEDLLKHGRGDGEDADAGRNIQAQHHPDQPELRRLMRVLEMDIARR